MYQAKHKSDGRSKTLSSSIKDNAIALQRKNVVGMHTQREKASHVRYGEIVQRVPCAGTNHDTSPEHLAIELDYVNRVDNSAREYELPQGSVDTHENGIHKTGYADLANVGDKNIYDIKRQGEPYPEAQLNRYLQAANASCEPGWTRGAAYGPPRVIPFSPEQDIRAWQDGAGVISYTKLLKGQRGIMDMFKVKVDEPQDEDLDGYGEEEWLGDMSMEKAMIDAGMINDSDYGPRYN